MMSSNNLNLNLHEETLYLEHFIQHEIFKNLPRLEENELKARDNALKETVFKKDRLKEYYEYIKKKYTDYSQLAYIDDGSLHDFYSYQLIYDQNKEKFISNFDFLQFLFHYYRGVKFITNAQQGEEEFKELITKRFHELDCDRDLFYNNEKDLWNVISFDEKLFTNDKLLNLVKYNPDYSSDSVYLEIKVLYPNLKDHLSTIINRRKNLKRMIISFKGVQQWDPQSNKIKEFPEGEVLHKELNLATEIIFKKLKNQKNLKALCLISEKKFELNRDNINYFTEISSSYSVNIVVLKDVLLTQNSIEEYFMSALPNYNLKYLHFEGLDFEQGILKLWMDMYDISHQHICYFSLDNENTLECLNEKKQEAWFEEEY